MTFLCSTALHLLTLLPEQETPLDKRYLSFVKISLICLLCVSLNEELFVSVPIFYVSYKDCLLYNMFNFEQRWKIRLRTLYRYVIIEIMFYELQPNLWTNANQERYFFSRMFFFTDFTTTDMIFNVYTNKKFCFRIVLWMKRQVC